MAGERLALAPWFWLILSANFLSVMIKLEFKVDSYKPLSILSQGVVCSSRLSLICFRTYTRKKFHIQNKIYANSPRKHIGHISYSLDSSVFRYRPLLYDFEQSSRQHQQVAFRKNEKGDSHFSMRIPFLVLEPLILYSRQSDN